MMRRSAAHLRLFSAIALVAVCAIVLAGCNWTGKGKTVAQALEKTSAYKSRAFTGSIKVKFPQMQTSGSSSSQPEEVEIDFKGAIDGNDPAGPKMTMTMDFSAVAGQGGESSTITVPGDGNVYIQTPTGTYGSPASASELDQSKINSAAIYAALGKAIGHFQTSQPMQNAQGQSVETIAAKVNKRKVCSDVLPAFGDVWTSASAGAEVMKSFAGGKTFEQFCKMMLTTDPKVWFGIQNGALTDVALDATLVFPMAGGVNFQLQYHEYDQGQPQSVKKPAGAQMVPSYQQLMTMQSPQGQGSASLGAASQ